MSDINRKIITKNILELIDGNGINDNEFANLIEKLAKTLVRIRKKISRYYDNTKANINADTAR